MANEKALSVRMHGKHIGRLEQTLAGKMQFTYDTDATYRLSIGMTVRDETYDEIRTEAYFGGLLPESEMARKKIGQRFSINHHNSFALLKAIGYDCAGAVSMHSMVEAEVNVANQFPLKAKVITNAELEEHIEELPKKPLFLGIEGLRLSLAGAQDKAAVCLIDNEIALPVDGCPTTHILKPAISGYDGIVQNEYLCLKIAEHVGLKVPKIEIRKAEKTPYLLIERYDRLVAYDTVSRIHQEDFCQALGFVTARKYQSDGGPDFRSCFALLRETNQPVKDRNILAALMIFNYLIGNTDAHGKNFSLVHKDNNTIEISPAYDIVCTSIYDRLAKNMAMKIGGYYELDKIYPRHWERECKEIGYSYPALRETIKKQAVDIMQAAEIESAKLQKANLFHPIIDQMLFYWDTRMKQTLKRFEA